MSERLPEVAYTFSLQNAGDASWHPKRFQLDEALFALYELSLDLVTDDLEVDLAEILGATAEFGIERGDNVRYITGVVRNVEFRGVEHDRFNIRVKIVPACWALTQRKDSRHWQEMSVPEILQDVLTAPLAEYGRTFRLDLQNTYPPREFCVQYREFDYDFIRRLMAEEGIYFYFDSSAGQGEVLVLADSNDVLPEVVLAEQGAMVSLCNANPFFVHEETIQTIDWKRRLDSTAVVQRDFDWVWAPSTPPSDEVRAPDTRGFEREVYSPGERRYEVDNTRAQATLKLRSLVAQSTHSHGTGNVTGFAPGYHFALDDHPLQEVITEHLVTQVTHKGTWQDGEVTTSTTGTSYTNSFETIPFDVPYRAPPATARPTVKGPQTAVVTGPGSEEIHVDKHGRVKIIMVWDRLSSPDDTSSCWVRVAQLSAGPGWGTMFIPRVGMEVLVEFLDGNPDRPLITGCVYNGDNPPPYALPGDKTKNNIKTNSSPGGGGSNEVRFEDAAGAEELYLHAQKDLKIVTGNNKGQTTGSAESSSVGGSRKKTIGAGEKETIAANKKSTVGANHTETIGANRTITVNANEVCTIGANQTITISSTASEDVAIAKSTTVGVAYALTVGGAIDWSVGAVLLEKIGAARIVTVGGVFSESVDGPKKVKAMKMSFKAKKPHNISAGTNYKAKAKGDIKLSSKKRTIFSAQDDLTFKSEAKIDISGTDEIQFVCGKASLTLKKGDMIFDGKKYKFKGKEVVDLRCKSGVTRN